METMNELIEKLQSILADDGDSIPSVFDLIRIAYGDRTADEHLRRHKIILRIAKAKREAGKPVDCSFF